MALASAVAAVSASSSDDDSTSPSFIISALASLFPVAYAANDSNPAPTVQQLSDTGVSGVSAANLAAIHSALGSAGVVADSVNTAAKVQVLVDTYNRILAEAQGGNGDATE